MLVTKKIVNRKDGPIYVSVEPLPECFELEPGDELTLIWIANEDDHPVQIDFAGERDLVVWPENRGADIQFLINGEEAAHRSWDFKHQFR
ncbi:MULTISPECIES: hypothetical protein [Methylobacteriaceae]|uniref:hypothetical protein n=1 Tax=Methylobacteriaceae TaxID=119045 RepID=UPI00074F82D0|nr:MULTISPECIES: hypothetical protein [Methylobacteriaceae]AMB45026.1 hypothetical protein Y590_08962 [Methylobacterium sp. AMS5]TFZ59183.1 hypothetical protein E4V01_09380 [Methylorubrum sp. Q1]